MFRVNTCSFRHSHGRIMAAPVINGDKYLSVTISMTNVGSEIAEKYHPLGVGNMPRQNMENVRKLFGAFDVRVYCGVIDESGCFGG